MGRMLGGKFRWLILLLIMLLLVGCDNDVGLQSTATPTLPPVAPTGTATATLSSKQYLPTYQARQTEWAEETATVMITPHLATSTPEPTPTATLDGFLETPMLFFQDHNHFYLVDVNDNEARFLGLGFSEFLTWVDDGCELVVRPNTIGETIIQQIDLQGNVTKVLHTRDWDNEGTVIETIISPQMDWIAFIIGNDFIEGGRDISRRHFGKIDVYTAPVDRAGEVHKLSSTGSVYFISWSNDGARIAFADQDSNQVEQAFIAQPDGTGKTRLTSFTDPNGQIRLMEWSPDNNQLALTVEGKDGARLLVLSLADITIGQFDLFTYINSIWWQDGSTLVASVDNSASVTTNSLLWYDVHSGSIIDSFPNNDDPIQNFATVRQMGDGTLGISHGGLYRYDPVTRSLTLMFNKFEIIDGVFTRWFPAPVDFPGERVCFTR